MAPPHIGSADQRLVLFYLANDILQNGRRKGADHFVELFKQPLRKGVSVIRWVEPGCTGWAGSDLTLA